MHADGLLVRCLAMREGEHWVALCLDFDLAAQGDSFLEVKERLDAQIVDFVTEAATIDREHAPYLLRRKAPLKYRLLYRWLGLRKKVAARFGNGRAAYERAMPLVPAHA